jgi:hypothetical protein
MVASHVARIDGEDGSCDAESLTSGCRRQAATASHRYRSSPDRLGERDEGALRATDITEPIAVLVLHQLATSSAP